MDRRRIEGLVHEHMLLSRHALQGARPYDRKTPLDRSATVLLSRLAAEGPMTVAELADVFDLDISTVHRQIAAAMKKGLVERLSDPAGGVARKHRATGDGTRRLAAELDARRASAERVVADWSDEDLDTFVTLLRRFNEGVEVVRGKPWPRRD